MRLIVVGSGVTAAARPAATAARGYSGEGDH